MILLQKNTFPFLDSCRIGLKMMCRYAVFCNISFELLISTFLCKHPNHRCTIKLGIAWVFLAILPLWYLGTFLSIEKHIIIFCSDSNKIRTHNHLVRKRILNSDMTPASSKGFLDNQTNYRVQIHSEICTWHDRLYFATWEIFSMFKSSCTSRELGFV